MAYGGKPATKIRATLWRRSNAGLNIFLSRLEAKAIAITEDKDFTEDDFITSMPWVPHDVRDLPDPSRPHEKVPTVGSLVGTGFLRN